MAVKTRATHTPGPWAVEHDEDDCGENFRVLMGDALTSRSAYTSHHVIDIYEGATHKPQALEILANANLIAAAPDMLAALKDLRALIIGEHGASAYANVNGERADAAIAKAEGQ